MVSWFIEKEDVGFEQHRAREGELHFPTTREGTDSAVLLLFIEANALECGPNLGFIRLYTLVRDNELDDRSIFLRSVNVVLHVERTNIVRGRETFDLAVGDSTHEGRLSGSILAAQTVTVATLQVKVGRVK